MKSTATQAEIDKFKLRKGDVIVTKLSEDSNDICIPALVMEDMDDVLYAYHLTVIKPYDLDFSSYIPHALLSKSNNAYFFVNSQGVTRFALTRDIMANIPIFIPPKEEQASIISAIAKENKICRDTQRT